MASDAQNCFSSSFACFRFDFALFLSALVFLTLIFHVRSIVLDVPNFEWALSAITHDLSECHAVQCSPLHASSPEVLPIVAVLVLFSVFFRRSASQGLGAVKASLYLLIRLILLRALRPGGRCAVSLSCPLDAVPLLGSECPACCSRCVV